MSRLSFVRNAILLLKGTSTFIITFSNIIVFDVLSTLLIIDVIINVMSVVSMSLSSTTFALIAFVLVHEFAHKVHADGKDREYYAENRYHLPLVVRFLCDERSVDRLSELLLLEKHQKVI